MCLYREEMIEMALVTLNTSSIFAMKAQAAKVLTVVAESGALKDDVNCAGLFIALVLEGNSKQSIYGINLLYINLFLFVESIIIEMLKKSSKVIIRHRRFRVFLY